MRKGKSKEFDASSLQPTLSGLGPAPSESLALVDMSEHIAEMEHL